ncbi:hypothetical protein RclHR1_12180002 [Rhizophagus clarus]|uniref:Kinase-like domain-containing protein n=1 Tax=Rhizophagus clarus TaxID=94130 RepID=A0A2Z6Q6G0_9GLOM|nr:hypothetical protein RclHR1_12180002 [Rhizophagus clarus]GES84339.1 kinase-like domain-containing protein [Rhizophagus clarus]
MYVLDSLANEQGFIYNPQIDLKCFVRSLYLMLHRPELERSPFGNQDDIKTRAYICNNRGMSELWERMYRAIENLDYDRLVQELIFCFKLFRIT